ncbi:MAG: hypothetical protein A3I61_20050 [Acidobacteria bacterium RIFCSPLOWO2_02_FULL_68_18]|nr:MAG: hypothetical protein A3I61_20050 [Acidobacteria bacterium RIFCSPLOWO2_02_FULL_68_18]OFW48339.1 MAG: hypothetical protein A3G77_03090 [Acidobacteria bacterium RIFCSPLOWO2_12_FULL_68_19]
MKEQDIRPEVLLQRYLELSAEDARECFGAEPRSAVACVACGGSNGSCQFDKNGFAYVRCADCGTLFQNPRPPLAAFETFYRNSKSSRYWSDVFMPAVAEIRREKMFRPRVRRLATLCRERGIHVERLVDVGAGYGIFLDEWRAHCPATDLLAVEPSASLASVCRSKGLAVVEEIVEHVVGHDGSADLVTCFEVLEHVHTPLNFVRALARLARPGGYVCISALCIDGFDLQMLWDKSTQISPPHHINFLSVCGFETLFARAGLEEVTVATPGQLDVDIVRNAAARNPGVLAGHRFLQAVLEADGTAARFQEFLSASRLSSHAWVLGRRARSR